MALPCRRWGPNPNGKTIEPWLRDGREPPVRPHSCGEPSPAALLPELLADTGAAEARAERCRPSAGKGSRRGSLSGRRRSDTRRAAQFQRPRRRPAGDDARRMRGRPEPRGRGGGLLSAPAEPSSGPGLPGRRPPPPPGRHQPKPPFTRRRGRPGREEGRGARCRRKRAQPTAGPLQPRGLAPPGKA